MTIEQTERVEEQGPVSEPRLESFRSRIASLRARSGGIPVERWLMIAGALLVVVGLPVIVLGWWGASRTPYVFEQIPYLISGGLLGLALAIVGGLVYFAFWMTRVLQETRRQSDATRQVLERIEGLLAQGAAGVAGRPKIAAVKGAQNGRYVATARGTMFHRADCAVVAGRSDLRKVKPNDPRLEPCRICDPLGGE